MLRVRRRSRVRGVPLRREQRARLPLRKSLFGRLLAVSALVAACSVAATAWLAVQTTSGAIKQEQGQNLAADAQIYYTLLGYAAAHPTWDGIDSTVHDLARQSGRRIALTTEQRRPLADSATRPSPPALPPEASAIVDPLSVDTALSQTVGRAGVTADRVDPRAVGPFRLPAVERTALQRAADRSVACLNRSGVAADVVRGPSGRPRIEVVGNDPDRMQGTRCASDTLDEPTATERKALGALNRLADACLKRQGRTGVQLNLDLSWGGGPEPMPSAGVSTPSPAPAPSVRTGDDDRATASCVGTARREQLSSYVASPALLFIGDEGGTTVPGFDLSPANTAKIAGAAALVLALTVGATMLAGARLVRPLHALTGAAQRMRDGEDSAPVLVTDDNEIGRLAVAFNDMAAHRARLEGQRKDMVSDVAHELRTPLSNIRGWLEAAQDGLAEPDPAFISSLHTEAVQLQHIIDDLQDLAAADAGALRLHPEPVRIEDVLGQVAAAHQGRAETAGVTLTVLTATAGTPGPELTADPVRLRQAIGNLVSNAVRHTPAGGNVTLHAYGSECADLVVVDVTDTGSGISAVDLPHVFDRFWRAEKSRSRRTGGSGLGLAIVRKLVEAHGGSVSAVSVDGQGSVFTLRLPTDPARTGSGEWGEAGGPGESQGPSTGMSASATGGCERGSGAGGPERAVGGRGSGAGQA
ncbi:MULTISPECIES: sensor histidine kinase [unclassified Streptomyces]|uniref:sensor histidine kinase n=1 Tax=unclassified Streptomyces TaxID=2593676 RepID=UPI00225914F5|nr:MULTISPECIES: HAMP domain-containing sensor histidine kinase [unclassified Streptomyces]WSP58899.1 HAMP domain-containing histidine kinase [Streptomyces sp. NBC_01241]WSU20582.1 HAMP domain-containing histidine kinase [Streptomyces sp. NBC_01108]MCX4790628.1 HAMP domain-containing histidine kinase [Streptomyces sp. NBC_01221]MCX4793643.1 HAMP domain-containing histidine kinase [Streptomyces sp. NBC_01242]WSJ35072.1 HAMP domain-containing histidine kinase [Streptomyces sp. NBC_01321]